MKLLLGLLGLLGLFGVVGLWLGGRNPSARVPQPKPPKPPLRPQAPAVTRPEPRVLLGFRNGSAVVVDPASDVARSMQTLALSLRTGLHRGDFPAEDH